MSDQKPTILNSPIWKLDLKRREKMDNFFFRKQVKKENYKEVMKNSWFLAVIWHVFNETNTNHEKKVTRRRIMRNWIITQDYKDDWCWYMDKKSWLDLKSIKVNKISPIEAHLKNVNDIWVSPNGKFARKILELNKGQYPVENPNNDVLKKGYFEDEKNKKIKRIVLFYPVLNAPDPNIQEKNLKKLVPHPPKPDDLYPFHIGPRKNYLRKDKLT